MEETPEQRSRTMRAVRSRDTKPELTVRRFLHAARLRYILHDRRLPGSPDLVFPKYRTVVFVHGCFWHQHANCHAASHPRSNTEYWSRKLTGNVERDARNRTSLEASGWRVLVIWECEIRERDALDHLAETIRSSRIR